MQSAPNQTYYTALEIDMVCKSITSHQDNGVTGIHSSSRKTEQCGRLCVREDWYPQQYDHEGNTFFSWAPKVQRVVSQCGMGARQPGIMHGLQGGATSLTSVPVLLLLSCATLEKPPDPLALH